MELFQYKIVDYQSYLLASCLSSSALRKVITAITSLLSYQKICHTLTGASFLQERHCSYCPQNMWLWDWGITVLSAFFNTKSSTTLLPLSTTDNFCKIGLSANCFTVCPYGGRAFCYTASNDYSQSKNIYSFILQWLQLDTLTKAHLSNLLSYHGRLLLYRM